MRTRISSMRVSVNIAKLGRSIACRPRSAAGGKVQARPGLAVYAAGFEFQGSVLTLAAFLTGPGAVWENLFVYFEHTNPREHRRGQAGGRLSWLSTNQARITRIWPRW